jgi:dCMP deaminase
MINKHKIYLEIALSISKLSKDESTKVGCCIIDSDDKVVSLGYNGFVSKADDSGIDYSGKEFTAYINYSNYVNILKDHYKTDNREFQKNNKFTINKNKLCVHAESNAIINTSDKNKLVGSTVYITHYPCNQCALMLAQCKVKEIYVLNNKTKSFDSYIKESLYVLQCANININVIHNLD